MGKGWQASGMDVAGRCKQCGQPYTDYDKVVGATGIFCSEACKERHEAFTKRAADLDDRKNAGASFSFQAKKAFFVFLKVAIVVAIVAAVSLIFHIPVLEPLFLKLKGMIGL